ncbi:Serpin B8 [Lamellibrachia satsuma]|nr:Serpin B8 [Lamellibrachia satsuma]
MCSLPSLCRSLINEWVKSATDGKIVDLLPPGSVFKDTVLVLANAITFQGYWKHAFGGSLTKKERFYYSSTRYVNMMHLGCGAAKLRYAYVPSIKSKVVELPFYNSKIAMYIVLPRARLSLSYVENRFSWNPNTLRLKSRSVEVSLPKFSVQKATTVTAMLKALGMTDLFDENKAKLPNVAGSSSKLWVMDVFHQAYINVHEKGTEASAATAVMQCIVPRGRAANVKFVANRPFLFFIWDRETNSLLFNGRFTG